MPIITSDVRGPIITSDVRGLSAHAQIYNTKKDNVYTPLKYENSIK